MTDTSTEEKGTAVKAKKQKSRWTGTNKKQRQQLMRALAVKRQAMMTPEEKSAQGIRLAGYRWHHNKVN